MATSTYLESAELIELAGRSGRSLSMEIDAGVFTVSADEARETFESLYPGEWFSVSIEKALSKNRSDF